MQEAHDSWDYKSQGLSGPGAAIIAIAVMVATQGMGVGALGALGVEGISGASAAMVNAGFSSLVAQASVSLINNQGNIGKVLQEMGSTQTLKNLAITVASAGAFYQVGTWTEGHLGDGSVLGQDGRPLTARSNISAPPTTPPTSPVTPSSAAPPRWQAAVISPAAPCREASARQ